MQTFYTAFFFFIANVFILELIAKQIKVEPGSCTVWETIGHSSDHKLVGLCRPESFKKPVPLHRFAWWHA